MITIKNLDFNYSKHLVFKNVSMNLEAGKIYGLLGQNGVGKTTLLKIICGLLGPKAGTCSVNGYKPSRREPGFLSDLCFIPEDPVVLDIYLNRYVDLYSSFYPKFDRDKYLKLIGEFGIDDKARMTKLSYGQQKKAIIAFALSTNTRLILLDEPSNGLDIPSKSQLRKVISQSSTDDSCIVISTHQVRDLENLIDPIIILDYNGVLLNASIDEISSKLFFDYSNSYNQNAIYSEQSLTGFINVLKNEESLESKVNIEVLFNTVYKNRELVNNIFKN